MNLITNRLSQIAFASFALTLANLTLANDEQEDGSVEINPIQVVEPSSDRREVYESQIDDEFFELGGYVGLLAIEDFGSAQVLGLKGSFHATEDFFLQANYAQADVPVGAAEDLNGGANIIADRTYSYYNLLVGYNIFPGETFINQDLTLNSAFYLVAGAGNTTLDGDDYFTISFGAGYRVILKDWLTLNLDMRNHTFESEVVGNVLNDSSAKRTNNIEFTTGLTAFF
ncbi:outer membrane beta-barrel domain-containing protein [Bermanella sp. R86510]|uniref:outer membrane beta-barrel domain-containing protein n=1 Tax=unclassified Bermanella TaxID=2627862 RepID=UPI0037C64FB4